MDEFTYLLRNEPAISSVFQITWDHLSWISQLKLILTGSLIGLMAREVFSYQAPLYCRATVQIRSRPLSFAAIHFPPIARDYKNCWNGRIDQPIPSSLATRLFGSPLDSQRPRVITP